jgi:hypothetical protein
MPSTGPRAKYWCFTLNNYTPANLDRLSTLPEGTEYLVYGREVGTSGTPHLQGTICFETRKRLNQVIATIGQAHCSVTRNLEQSIEYCKKDGDFLELGVPPQQKKGTRSDLDDFKATVKEGVTCMKTLRDMHSEVCAKYPQFVADYVIDWREKQPVTTFPLRPWQSDLYQKLIVTPTSGEELIKFQREINFIVDHTGNQGKSWFCRYYCDRHDNAQIIVPGKKADMARVIREDCRVFFFDCPRSKQGEFIQYDLLEELKNGNVFSGKYQSVMKRLPTPHIVVCMNEYPDMTKLSHDRYVIKKLDD